MKGLKCFCTTHMRSIFAWVIMARFSIVTLQDDSSFIQVTSSSELHADGLVGQASTYFAATAEAVYYSMRIL